MANERLPEQSIPDRSPGHAFVQSLMPAGAGTPRYENWVHWLMEESGVVCATHPAPSWTSPSATFLFRPWAVGRVSVVGVAGRCRGSFIPDRSPGHAFVPIAHAGWRRHTKV